jgi:hypothetical protein
MEFITKRSYRHRQEHFSREVITNLVGASNCLGGLHSVTWGVRAGVPSWHYLRAQKKPTVGTVDISKLEKLSTR